MKWFLTALLFASSIASATDFQPAKILDVQPSKQAGPIITNGAVGIPIQYDMLTVTVAIADMSYSASYYASRHFKPANLVVGDSVPAKVDGEFLFLRRDDGKEVKARIARRAHLPESK